MKIVNTFGAFVEKGFFEFYSERKLNNLNVSKQEIWMKFTHIFSVLAKFLSDLINANGKSEKKHRKYGKYCR